VNVLMQVYVKCISGRQAANKRRISDATRPLGTPENLDAIPAAVDLSQQPGVAVNMVTGLVAAVSDSPQVFREHISLRLANIEAVARRALEIGGGVVIW
jgi:hypothetical protein